MILDASQADARDGAPASGCRGGRGAGRLPVRLPLLALLAAAVVPGGLAAQAVQGMIYDEASSSPVSDVEVRLLTPDYEEVALVRTDRLGRFTLRADLPGPYVLSASAEGYVATPPHDVELQTDVVSSVVLALRPVPGVRLRGRAAEGPDAYVYGLVVDREGQDPVEGAEVTLIAAGDTVRTLTRWNGRFVVPELPPGPVTVRVEHLAYAPEERLVEMEAGKAYQIDVTMRQEAIELPGIEVTVRARSMARYLQPFYERMDLGLGGEYLSRRDLEAWGPQPVGYALSKLPSVRVYRGLGGYWDVSARGRAGACRGAAVFVDELLVHRPEQGATDMLEMSTSEVEGIEFYPGPATLPPEFNYPGVECAIVIWTRRGG